MKKIFEDFLNLFFPDSDNDDEEKNPLWQKVLGFFLIIIVITFFVLASK